jgi:hypothetical protein
MKNIMLESLLIHENDIWKINDALNVSSITCYLIILLSYYYSNIKC